ncbi:MAG: hypothetical protein MUF71_05030 [Candidatus Kapabacteria bacterium]|nr:hypothetical protein [Candidatus Kapabacteria bacterium]
MKSALEDLEHRRPVWVALSDLYLDTEMDDGIYSYIARTCRESPYSWEECEQILWDEVHPVCVGNLLVVAGEWAAFDEQWLEERIISHIQHWGWVPFKNHHRKFRFFRSVIEQDWSKVRAFGVESPSQNDGNIPS